MTDIVPEREEVTDNETALAYIASESDVLAQEKPEVKASVPVYEINWNDQQVIDLLKTLIAPNHSNEELALFILYCQRTRLDPFARQIYSLKRRQYDNATNGYVLKQTIQTSIDGFRLIADRTHRYAGQRGPFWCDAEGNWSDVWLDPATPPYAAKVGVDRHDFNDIMWSVALYNSYCQTNSNGQPLGRWKTDPAGMLAKCAEALALRRAFPQELSGLYTGDEMDAVENTTPVVIPAKLHGETPAGNNPLREASQKQNGDVSPKQNGDVSRAEQLIDKQKQERKSKKAGDPEMEKWLSEYKEGMMPSEFEQTVAEKMTWEDAGKLLTLKDKKPLDQYVTADLRRLIAYLQGEGLKRPMTLPEVVILIACAKLIDHYDPPTETE